VTRRHRRRKVRSYRGDDGNHACEREPDKKAAPVRRGDWRGPLGARDPWRGPDQTRGQPSRALLRAN